MGDIRKSIREEVGKKLKKPNSRWNPDTQPNIYELSNFLQKSGYRLVDILVHEDYPELLIEAIKPGYLFPEISHDIKEKEFYAKVEDHGLMIASDIEEIIKGYETAIGVLHHLEELDLSKLEIDKEEK